MYRVMCYLLHVVRCMLYVTGCILCVVCCMYHVLSCALCVLHFVLCMLYVFSRCVLHVVYFKSILRVHMLDEVRCVSLCVCTGVREYI